MQASDDLQLANDASSSDIPRDQGVLESGHQTSGQTSDGSGTDTNGKRG